MLVVGWDLAGQQWALNNVEVRITTMKMRNVLTYGSVFVLLLALAFPISAGAFGRSPSESEVHKQPATMASPQSMTTATGDGNTTFGEKVPEPSSLLLIGIALGVGALVAMLKWKRQEGEK